MTVAPADFRRSYPEDAAFSEWTGADGWVHRRFDWPVADARGRILVLGGRGDIIEKYLETMAHLHDRGWSVSAFDWRGQGGSGRLARDPHVGHADDFGVFVHDLGRFWHDWHRNGQDRALILAHSMGAHIALRALADDAIDPAAVLLVAPMVGIRSPLGGWIGERVAWALTRLASPARPAWKPNRKSAGHRQKLLTHDGARFADEAWWYARRPDLLLGPPSWAWVLEAFRSGRSLSADPRIARIAVPVLMLVAEADRLVDPAVALRLAARLPDVSVVRFGTEAAHELLRESDAVRTRVLAAIDAFLDARA